MQQRVVQLKVIVHVAAELPPRLLRLQRVLLHLSLVHEPLPQGNDIQHDGPRSSLPTRSHGRVGRPRRGATAQAPGCSVQVVSWMLHRQWQCPDIAHIVSANYNSKNMLEEPLVCFATILALFDGGCKAGQPLTARGNS